MNEELLKLNEILDTSDPVELSKSTRPWVIECLKEVGWNEGDRVPGNLQNYFASVFRVLGLPKTPDSIHKAIEHEEVRMTLTSAIRKVYEKDNATKVAEEKFADFAGSENSDNPLMRQIFEEAVKAEAAKIQNDTPEKKEEPEEDFSDLEQEQEQAPPTFTSLPICPCCQWDLTKPYNSPEITDKERRAYLLYVMGGPTFTRKYDLWGGQCSVTFKTTSTQDEDLVIELYAKDLREGKLETTAIAQKKFNQYHLALSLSKLTFNPGLGIPSPVVPSVWSSDFDPTSDKLRLQKFMEKWYLNTIESVELESALMIEWRKFSDLLVQLQQELNRRDFWNGATSV